MSLKIAELAIPVPWGQIAAKTWGNENDEIVFAFHGKMDNAGSFDGLIPLLPTNFYYVCFDLPCHGKSSFVPQFFFTHTLDFLPIIKLLVDRFKRNSYIIIGHSLGALLAQYFSRLYPQHVKKLIMLDSVIMGPREVENMKNYLVTSIDKVVKMYDQSKESPKKYTYEEALERVKNFRLVGSLTQEQAVRLLNRSLEPVGDGKYIFTIDRQPTIWLDPLHDKRYSLASLEQHPILCPVLFVLANQTLPAIKRTYTSLEVVKKWNNAVVKFVDGTHDVHMTHPERVAPYVTEFLIKGHSKL